MYFRPDQFADPVKTSATTEMIPSDMLPPSGDDSEEDEDSSGLLVANPNRPLIERESESEDSSIGDDEYFGNDDHDSEQDEQHSVG